MMNFLRYVPLTLLGISIIAQASIIKNHKDHINAIHNYIINIDAVEDKNDVQRKLKQDLEGLIDDLTYYAQVAYDYYSADHHNSYLKLCHFAQELDGLMIKQCIIDIYEILQNQKDTGQMQQELTQRMKYYTRLKRVGAEKCCKVLGCCLACFIVGWTVSSMY